MLELRKATFRMFRMFITGVLPHPPLPFPTLATTRVLRNTPLPASSGGLLRPVVPPNPYPLPRRRAGTTTIGAAHSAEDALSAA